MHSMFHTCIMHTCVYVQDESMMSKAFHSMAIYILMNLPDSSSILSFRKAVYICMTLNRSVSIFFIFLQRGRRRHEIVACIQFTTVFVQRTVSSAAPAHAYQTLKFIFHCHNCFKNMYFLMQIFFRVNISH